MICGSSTPRLANLLASSLQKSFACMGFDFMYRDFERGEFRVAIIM